MDGHPHDFSNEDHRRGRRRDMTRTNVRLGSPGYISPEQGRGLSVDFRSASIRWGHLEMVTLKTVLYHQQLEIIIQHIMAAPPKPQYHPSLPKT
jgi:hypothetical protein